MAEWTSVADQIVNPGESITFTENTVRCTRSLVLHRDDTGSFLVKGQPVNPQCYDSRQCCCQGPKVVNYKVNFGANVAVPTGETLGPITVAIVVDGATLNGTTMESTPAAVEEYNSISRKATVPIFYGCCQTVTIRNTSPIPISVRNAIINIEQ